MLIMSILLVLLPFKVFGTCLNHGFIVPAGYAKIMAVATGIGGILNVIFDYICIDRFGYIGVFWVTLVIHSLSITTVTGYFLFIVYRQDRRQHNQASQDASSVVGTGNGDDSGD